MTAAVSAIDINFIKKYVRNCAKYSVLMFISTFLLQDEWNEVYIGDVKFTILMPCGRYFNYLHLGLVTIKKFYS